MKAIVLAILIAVVAYSEPDTTVTAIADTYVSANNPTTNYGSTNELVIGNNPGDLQAFLKFRVARTSVKSTVETATLYVYCLEITGIFHTSTSRCFITSYWAEYLVTWNTRPSVYPS